MPNFVWVCLIQKTPHGPLTLEEMEMLLERRIIHPNDVAMKIDSENSKNNSGWKLLFEFPEFQGASHQNEEVTHTQIEVVPEEIPNQLMDDVLIQMADEITKIIPEDLIVRKESHTNKPSPKKPEPSSPQEASEPYQNEKKFSFFRSGFFTVFSICALGGVYYYFSDSPPGLMEAEDSATKPKEATKLPVQRPLQRSSSNVRAPITNIEAPVPRSITPPSPPLRRPADMGEVSRSQIEKPKAAIEKKKKKNKKTIKHLIFDPELNRYIEETEEIEEDEDDEESNEEEETEKNSEEGEETNEDNEEE